MPTRKSDERAPTFGDVIDHLSDSIPVCVTNKKYLSRDWQFGAFILLLRTKRCRFRMGGKNNSSLFHSDERENCHHTTSLPHYRTVFIIIETSEDTLIQTKKPTTQLQDDVSNLSSVVRHALDVRDLGILQQRAT